MFIYPEKTRSRQGPAPIGPPPWYHRSDCHICQLEEGVASQLTAPSIHKGKHFLVQHAPLKLSNAGTAIIEPRRHLLDFGEMTPIH
jgi:hypothetical protein